MASKPDNAGRGGIPWRIIGWGTAVALLALPFAAMQLTSEVTWTEADFVVFGAMIALVGGAFELAVRASGSAAYRAAAALALLAAFLVTWANLAVGIVGSEDNAANLLFFAALAVGIVGAVVGRLKAEGMAKAMAATALALGVAFAIAAMGGSDEPSVPRLRELAGSAVFAALFLGSAGLFRMAARVSRA
jgi:hypothetical protein